ncbi:HTH-type transcriptional repressor CytR [Corynebacterium glaucum]|uniref:HTH-type transcriptional repressor CytR n=1 Tax=Corynebacterium glaucum TaxID=187491 RepID=A0A1Q2HY19_9CORY|nr:LacI family DNA-binding transcriptional regulator [Corynebacterium glaucum]AQQ15723.1 HTH-type transcriptional repressor CytR [Corynebacterium glaucum]
MSPRRATLRDVAEQAGVSVSTASRALSGFPAISTTTRDRVEKAARELNYLPNLQARGLRNSNSAAIGLTVPSLVNPYFAEMATAIQQAAERDGYSTVTASTHEDATQFDAALRVFQSQQLSGFIIVPAAESADAIEELKQNGHLIVQVDRRLQGLDLPSVVSDPEVSIHEAVGLLYENGHRRIGYLAEPSSTSTGVQRLACFESAVANHPDLEPVIYRGGYRREEGHAGTMTLLRDQVTAVIAGDSMMTTGALEACYEMGMQPGVDLALIGFDDQPAFRIQPAPLTVIDQNVTELGRRAWAKLHAMLQGEDYESEEVLPTRLIVRESSKRTAQPRARQSDIQQSDHFKEVQG